MSGSFDADNSSENAYTRRLHEAKRHLQHKRYGDAIALLKPLLDRSPQDVEALYITAVSQRYLGFSKQALSTLRQLQNRQGNYARAYQEEGHNLRSIDPRAAINAYEQAVALNPALVASWMNLAALYKDDNNMRAAEHASSQVAYWQKMPPEVVSVSSMLNEGKLSKAEALCRYFLQQHPKHTEAMRLLAAIGVVHKVYDDAEFLLESCLRFAPEFTQARLDYVNVLQRRQKYQKALEQAQLLYRSSPEELRFMMALANAYQAVGDCEQAITLYADLLARVPEDAGVLIMQGHAYKTIGQTEQAVNAYQKASRCQFSYGDAYWSLANLKTYVFSEAEITRMRELEQAPATPFEDRFHLSFALGKACEDKRQFEQSFYYYQRGNALKKQQLGYSAERVEAECNQQQATCTEALFKRNYFAAPQAPYSARPIFIVGLPRAGSTLLEQILSSHSMVDGTMELPNIMSLSHRLGGRRGVSEPSRYPAILKELSPEQCQKFGQAYLQETVVYRQGAPYFIDKMPNNFRHIGLIKLILPNAIIIDARRDPMSCGFSVYKQLFAEGQEFSYDFDDIGRYYKNYMDLMQYWQTLFPDAILRMQYEAVVTDLEQQVKALLDFCGLPFEEDCINFHQTQRAVRTASAEQVRQPIFKTGLQQWQHFAPQLQPLQQALQKYQVL